MHELQNLEACVRPSTWLFSELVPTVARRSDESLQGSLLSMPIPSLHRVQEQAGLPSSSQQQRREEKLHVREVQMASMRWVRGSSATRVYQIQRGQYEGVVLQDLLGEILLGLRHGYKGAGEWKAHLEGAREKSRPEVAVHHVQISQMRRMQERRTTSP